MRTPALLKFCEAIQNTALSQAVESHSSWLIPLVQSVHIVAISALMMSAFLFNVGLLRLNQNHSSFDFGFDSFQCGIKIILPILIATGIVMILGEPARSLANSAFQLKMLLLISVLVAFFYMQAHARQDNQYWYQNAQRRLLRRIFATFSILAWMGIVFSGRWIAYLYS